MMLWFNSGSLSWCYFVAGTVLSRGVGEAAVADSGLFFGLSVLLRM